MDTIILGMIILIASLLALKLIMMGQRHIDNEKRMLDEIANNLKETLSKKE